MNDSNNDISSWNQSGEVQNCGYFPEKEEMGSYFWANIESHIAGRSKYLFVRGYRAAADGASRQIKKGDRVLFSGKQGSNKDKKTGEWAVCLDFNSFAVLAEERNVDEAQGDGGMDDVPMF